MPGVLNSNSQIGFSREVGKMASFTDPPLLNLDIGLEDIANKVLFGSSSSIDSDMELPDNETPMDLLKYLENDIALDLDNRSFADYIDDDLTGPISNITTDSPSDTKFKFRTSSVSDPFSTKEDPFMGMGGQESSSPTAKNSLLSQMMSPLDYDDSDQHTSLQSQQKQQAFQAWGHRSVAIKEEPDDTDDYCDDFDIMIKSYASHTEDEQEDIKPAATSFMDTPSPSSQSGTATGDDSDVDIETITETPSDLCGYLGGSSTSSSRAASPTLRGDSLLSILAKTSVPGSAGSSSPSSASSSTCSSPRPSPTIHFNTYGVSSSASLAENLMKGRTSLLGQKRKLSKERRAHHHHHQHHQLESRISPSSNQPYNNVLCMCTSNSINFHDYAMSPLSPECSPSPYIPSLLSTETGLPTISQTKRVYKRKQIPLDASDKEKQHHHNQLERNRRQKLADLFIDLRDEVPKIMNQSKASKVMILNEAKVYINQLQDLDDKQERDISHELKRKEVLSRQLRHLRSQLGGGRVG